jgi:hypothetical protein
MAYNYGIRYKYKAFKMTIMKQLSYFRAKLEQEAGEAAAIAAARAAEEVQQHAQQAPYHKARTQIRKVTCCKPNCKVGPALVDGGT